MSLLEVLIASVMAIICIVAIISSYLAVLNWSQINKEETAAMTHLSNIMEAIRSTPFTSIVTNFPNNTVDGPTGNSYDTIAGGYTLTNEHITVSYVNPASDPLEINVAVRWTNAKGANRARYLVTKRTK